MLPRTWRSRTVPIGFEWAGLVHGVQLLKVLLLSWKFRV